MPSVNLMALTPFNKNKDIWNYFFKENIMANLMANGCDQAIFSDEVPGLPHPALSNNIQDQRDFFTRVQKQEESVAKLKEKLATGYAIISRLVTGPETRALIKQAETGVPLGQEYRLRHLCRNIIALMDMKYASNDISLNAVLIGKWTAFRWTHRYGFNQSISSDPRDCRYSRIEDFAVDFNIAVDEYSIFDPVTTNNQLAMVQLLLTKLSEFEGIREAVKIAASRGATTIEYWRFYLSEIQHKMRQPTIIYQDNASAIIISNTLDKNFKKVKYFLMRINKVNYLIEQDVIELVWLETLNQLADIGTKPTTPKRFNYLDERLRGVVKMILTPPMDLEDFGVSKV